MIAAIFRGFFFSKPLVNVNQLIALVIISQKNMKEF